MKEFFYILKKTELFRDIGTDNLEAMLKCLGSEIKTAGRDEIILLAGSKPENIGIVLSGKLHIIKEDYNGNRFILAAITPGGIFAEALCCAGIMESPVTVVADTACVIMLLRFSRILNICSNTCAFHTKLIANMLKIVAGKNLILQNRMEITALKSVREKVMRYLLTFTPLRRTEFEIPFSREEMADYICTDRSALSHELSKMKKDGLIDYKKNKFVIL